VAIVAGIDEAGLGPVLGPLVVSAGAFRLDDCKVQTPLWSLLAEAVSRKPGRAKARIAVADSKKLYNPSRDNPLEHLERAVLAFQACRSGPVDSMTGLLDAVCPEARGHWADYPWYVPADFILPCATSAQDMVLSANSLRSAMLKAGLELIDMRSQVVFEGEFNRLISNTDNKAEVLFSVTGRLIDRLWSLADGHDLHLYVDRQGGRWRYLPSLQRIFEGSHFRVIDESEQISVYHMTHRGRHAFFTFSVDAEDLCFTVALASMLSKYIRELFMSLFNRFWALHSPGIHPTAGYYVDGRRFYKQILPVVRQLGYDQAMIYRVR